jgi:hypothetical protein
MNEVDPNAFWDSVEATIWWRKVGYMEVHHMMEMCEYAHKNNEKFYIQGPCEQVDLTNIYDQCIIHHLLKKDYHGQD